VVFSFIGLVEQTDDHERHGGRKNPGDRSELHHNYRLNQVFAVHPYYERWDTRTPSRSEPTARSSTP
jgi:hypothetical protein